MIMGRPLFDMDKFVGEMLYYGSFRREDGKMLLSTNFRHPINIPHLIKSSTEICIMEPLSRLTGMLETGMSLK